MPPLEALFPIGLSLHFEHDRFLNDPVGNGITKNRVGKNFTPVLDRKLGGHDGGQTFNPSIHKVVYIL